MDLESFVVELDDLLFDQCEYQDKHRSLIYNLMLKHGILIRHPDNPHDWIRSQEFLKLCMKMN